MRLSYQVFNGHVDLETIKRPQRVNGVEGLLPRSLDDSWQFKVRDGVERVRFGNPGYRLGYAKDAVNSYFVFKTLREKGVLPKGLRFQISMPMVNSVVRSLIFPAREDLPRVRPGYEEAIAAELAAIFEAIPHEDLAISMGLRVGSERRPWRPKGRSRRDQDRNACGANRAVVATNSRKGRPGIPFLLRNLRRMAAVRAGRLGADGRTGKCGGRLRPADVLTGCIFPRSIGATTHSYAPLSKLDAKRRPRLSRPHSQHGKFQTTPGSRPKIPSGFRFSRVLRVRANAARATTADPSGPSQSA